MSAPVLAPDRDNSYRMARPKGGGVTFYSVPGVTFQSLGATIPTTASDIYQPWVVHSPIVIDQLAAEITTAQASQNFRIGIYAADSSWQPVGAPLADSGDLSTASLVVLTYTPGTPIYLPRGRYLGVFNTSATSAGFRAPRGQFQGSGISNSWGSAPFISQMRIARAYAAFPTPGTAWTTVSGLNDGMSYFFGARISGA